MIRTKIGVEYLTGIVFLVGLLAIGQAGGETGTLQGTLVDEIKDTPIRGAEVRLIGDSGRTKSNFKGEFTLTVPAGTYAGMIVDDPHSGILDVIEAELIVEASVVENLGKIEVRSRRAEVHDPPGGEGGSRQEGRQSPPNSEPAEKRDRAWLGIFMRDWSLEEGREGTSPNEETVIIVARVYPQSPAQKAGFREGDVLLSLDGRPLGKTREFQERLKRYAPGQKARFLVLRGSKVVPSTVEFEAIPESVLRSLNEAARTGSPHPSRNSGNSSDRSQQSQQPAVPPVHPLIREARGLAAAGRFREADEKYEAYLKQYPRDGRVLAERAEMVYYNIQQARGMALMAQAVKKPGLTVPERTRLRLIIAQRRLESGNLITAKQMLVEALREDPGNPTINRLLGQIAAIEAESAARRGGVYVLPGTHFHHPLELELYEEIGEILEDWADEN